MITSVRVIRWSNIDVFWERPVSCLPTIIKIGQTSFAMFRDPTNKPWARCLCILKSSLGRVLQRFRKNGVIEGDGRGSSAGRQQPPQRPQADGSRRCRQLRAQADGSRRAPGQEAPADVRARAGSPCRRARARRLTGARAGSPCMRAHSAGQRARAPCGQCLPARAPRADSAGLRGRAGRRQQTGARAQTAPADLRARSLADHCRRARRPGRPLPTHAHAWADHCRRARWPGRPLPMHAHAWADHCRRARMPGPTTADARLPASRHVRGRLGRPLPTWARWGGRTAAALSGNVRPTCGRALDVRRLWPWTTPVSTGLSGTFSGTRTASKATGTDDVRRRPRDVDGPTGAACWVFVISRKAPSLSCGCAHTLALWHIFHLGLGTVLIRDLAIFS